MDIFALILAAVAFICFLLDYLPYPVRRALTPLGLALLTLALICQFTGLSGTLVHR